MIVLLSQIVKHVFPQDIVKENTDVGFYQINVDDNIVSSGLPYHPE